MCSVVAHFFLSRLLILTCLYEFGLVEPYSELTSFIFHDTNRLGIVKETDSHNDEFIISCAYYFNESWYKASQWSHEFFVFSYCKNKINLRDCFDLVCTTFTSSCIKAKRGSLHQHASTSFPKLWQLSPSKNERAPTMYTWMVVAWWSLQKETKGVSVNWGHKDHRASLFSTHLPLYSSLTCVRAMCEYTSGWINMCDDLPSCGKPVKQDQADVWILQWTLYCSTNIRLRFLQIYEHIWSNLMNCFPHHP